MASLKVNPDNSITLPIPLLGILLAAFLAVAGWGASLVGRVGEGEKRMAALETWRDAHEKRGAEQLAAVQAANAKTEASAADYYARSTAQNAAIQETLTTVRIQLASKR